MSTCPNCIGRAFVMETRRDHKGNCRRRFQCAECRYRWTEWNGDAPVPTGPPTSVTADVVRDILTSTGTNAEVAARYQLSASAIGQIRRGELHAGLAPDVPRWSAGGFRGIRRVCRNCIYWNDARCDLGFPDPHEEGQGFARDCAMFRAEAA